MIAHAHHIADGAATAAFYFLGLSAVTFVIGVTVFMVRGGTSQRIS